MFWKFLGFYHNHRPRSCASRATSSIDEGRGMVQAMSLWKAEVPPSLIPNPSPGSLQSTRLALTVGDDDSSCHVYIASGCQVYRVEMSMVESAVMKGKESLLIPIHAEIVESSVLHRCPHRHEIQSIVLAETDHDAGVVLGTVDAYGHLIVSHLDSRGQDVDRPTYSVSPQGSGVGEGSWAGLSFSPINWPMVAVAHGFCKSVDVYDQDIPIRSLRTLWYPSSLCFLHGSLPEFDSSSIIAVTEGCQLTIWDLRTYHNGGCVQRICGFLGDPFYAVCCSSAGNVAVGGSDRTITVYDPRRWSAVSRWVNCSKYEITGLSFSSINPDYVYIQGVDYEVFCGNWRDANKAFSFRGDSNWLGFSKSHTGDVLGGWCDSGSIFVANVVGEQQ